MRNAIALVALLALGGCLSYGDFENNLAGLRGQPVQAAFDVLGYPSTQQQFGDDTVYTWSSSMNLAMPTVTTHATQGSAAGTPFNATTTSVGTTRMTAACELKLIADQAGIVKKYQYQGNGSGCEPFMRRLHEAATQ